LPWKPRNVLARQEKYRLGAVVVVYDNQGIGTGWNQPIHTSDPTAHAEIVALGACMRKLIHICFGVLKHQTEYSPQVAQN
jgi:tRNA(Arg) A34 adenosine deaminase TadA